MLKTSANSNSETKAEGLSSETTRPDLNGLSKHAGTAESRFDPITGNWTIFAPHREQRPNEFRNHTLQPAVVNVDCPFCGGAESKTPPAVWIGRLADAPCEGESGDDAAQAIYRGTDANNPEIKDWNVRVVPNRYPAITLAEYGLDSRDNQEAKAETDLFRREVISGGHEVIIESRRHVRSLTELDLAEVSLLFAAYRDRIAHWSGMPGIAYISVFKNVGEQAGASLTHSHSQLIASNIVPSQLKTVVERMAKYRARTGCCLQCDLIRSESKEESRIVAKTDSLVAYCPFASPMQMLVRITSQKHVERFDQLDDETLSGVSRLVTRVISWLEQQRPGVSYNMLLHSRPPGIKTRDSFHWSIDIFPRLTRLAGFEFSTDCKINPMMPETAAQRFRECASAEDPRVVL